MLVTEHLNSYYSSKLNESSELIKLFWIIQEGKVFIQKAEDRLKVTTLYEDGNCECTRMVDTGDGWIPVSPMFIKDAVKRQTAYLLRSTRNAMGLIVNGEVWIDSNADIDFVKHEMMINIREYALQNNRNLKKKQSQMKRVICQMNTLIGDKS